ncbi:hypothetical protein [Nocardia camponoti]|uniref:Uncharacterized protein n=1 Tax=Nocardia camponoti TaxID=1616106 RepID=A0A917QD64_9NOCA|nr:hypothetical protein [Nocardia camponoti]GGK44826.1 hypothetical protein GCM10011591_15540 [Nocardia camponoti]
MKREQLEFIPPHAKLGDVRDISVASGPHPMHVLLWGHLFSYEYNWAMVDGVPRVTDLRVKPLLPDVALTARDLHRIPLQRLASAGAMTMGGGEFDWARFGQPEVLPPQKPGPRGYDDEFYAEIAVLARFAAASHFSVRQHIAKAKSVSAHTADKWLKECRKRDLLTPGELRRNNQKGNDQS